MTIRKSVQFYPGCRALLGSVKTFSLGIYSIQAVSYFYIGTYPINKTYKDDSGQFIGYLKTIGGISHFFQKVLEQINVTK